MNGETNGDYGANGTDGHPPAIASTVEEFLARTYDFLIIGGGTAGLTLAARLTENPDTTVGVIEAGKNRLNDPYVDTPALFLQTLGNPEYDWMMSTTPQVSIFPCTTSQMLCVLTGYPGCEQRQGTSYAARKAARWLQWYQLHDVSEVPPLASGVY